MRFVLSAATAMLAVTTPFLAVSAQEPDPPATATFAADVRFTELRLALIEKVRTRKIPSIAIAVLERGTPIWVEAIGWADREQRVPATPATTYALGSLSKSLTGTTLLTLADRGLVELDAPLDRWVRLPAPTGIKTQPTLRHLLDASGGVPHGWVEAPIGGTPATREAWDHWIEKSAFLAFAPGTVFEYSNNSFGVAARVAERATGESFGAIIDHALFQPLGMRASRANLSAAAAQSIALPYTTRGNRLPLVAEVPEAGLGMYSSAADLARFGAFVLGDTHALGDSVLSPALRAMIWQPSVGPSRDYFHFGFWKTGGGLATTGNIVGANAHLSMDRQSDLVVAVTVNQTGNDADEAAGAILDVLRPASVGGRDLRAEYAALYQQPYHAESGLLGAWVGTIVANAATIPLGLEAGQDSVLVRLGAGPWLPFERPRLNMFGELRGSLTTESPGLTLPASGPTRLDFVLKWEGTVLRGYLLPRDDIAQPLPIRLARPQP